MKICKFYIFLSLHLSNSIAKYISKHFRTTSSMRLSVGDLRRKSVSSNASDTSETNTTASTAFEATLRQDLAIPVLNELQPVPAGVNDFDRENMDDPAQVSDYAMEIFNYLKDREAEFKIDAYLERQPHLTSWMRTLLVDWMVEVQETFELNHETLYLAVKIVDIYLSKVTIEKEKLQLIGAAALFMSCKYDVSVRQTFLPNKKKNKLLNFFHFHFHFRNEHHH